MREQLRQRRIDLGITRRAVANKLGVTEQTLYKWESGPKDPPKHALIAWQAVVEELENDSLGDGFKL